VEYFTLFFDNRTKVIFYLKARSFKQYLAVASFPSGSHSPDMGKAAFAFLYTDMFSFGRTERFKGQVPDFGQMKCEMVLYLDSGPAYDLRWCPLPSHDMVLIILLLRICSCPMYFFFWL
jgi:hypothetical protein